MVQNPKDYSRELREVAEGVEKAATLNSETGGYRPMNFAFDVVREAAKGATRDIEPEEAGEQKPQGS